MSLANVYLLSLLTLPLFFAASYIFNHQHDWISWLDPRRSMYFFAVILPFGIILPGLVLGWLIRQEGGSGYRWVL